MQIVIDIDNELYQMCKDLHGDADPVESAIANGTPLTKEPDLCRVIEDIKEEIKDLDYLINDCKYSDAETRIHNVDYLMYEIYKILDRHNHQRDGKQDNVLDKIRAEIEQLPTAKCTETRRIYIDATDFKENILAILDKYKTESEEQA